MGRQNAPVLSLYNLSNHIALNVPVCYNHINDIKSVINMNDDALTHLPLAPAFPLSSEGAVRLVQAFFSGRKATTLRAYQNDLNDFRRFVGVETLGAAADMLLSAGPGRANALVLAYRSQLLEAGRTTATVSRRLAVLRSLVKLARVLGMVPWMLEIASPKVERYRDTSGPGADGVRRLLHLLDQRHDAKAKRDRAAIRLLFDLGLRRGEVVHLDVDDLDLQAGKVAVLGKGREGKEPLTLPLPTQQALADWLAVRGSDPGPLFTNFDRACKGRRLSGTSLYRLVRDLGQQAGLRNPVRPHGLRHSAITEALDRTNGNVRVTAKFSRHRDLRVLAVYDDNRLDVAGEVATLVALSV